MTREEAIAIARNNPAWDFFEISESNDGDIDHLVGLMQAAAAVEREACAKVCEAQVEPVGNEWRWKRPEEAAEFDAQNRARLGCAAAIRMRSNHANPPA